MKHLLRTLILWLVRLIGAPGVYAAARKLRKAQKVTAPRILLIRPDHLGDLVLTTPVLQALKSQVPEAHITMLVGPWASEVVARHPAIDRLMTCGFPGFQRASQKAFAPYVLLFRMAQQLRRGNYDLAINLRPDFWWGAALHYLAGIPRRVGYAIQPGRPFLTHTLAFSPHEHSSVYNLRLGSAGLQALGYDALEEPYTPERYPLTFTPSEDERKWVGERLGQEGVDGETPIIVIHPGTGGAVKLWRSEGWPHVANTLVVARAFSSTPRIVLTGGPHERPLLAEIERGMMSAAVVINDMTVGQLAALLGRAQLVLGVDNGPLHLAVSQNRPTLQIFGPTDVRIFGPWGPAQEHVVLTSTYRCPTCPAIPCGRLDFSAEEVLAHPCVRRITEQQVEEAIAKLLGKSILPLQNKN